RSSARTCVTSRRSTSRIRSSRCCRFRSPVSTAHRCEPSPCRSRTELRQRVRSVENVAHLDVLASTDDEFARGRHVLLPVREGTFAVAGAQQADEFALRADEHLVVVLVLL